MTQETKQKVFKILDITANVLIWIFVAFSIIITALVFTANNNEDGVPELFGKSLITIESESMEPTFKKGDLVFMEKLDTNAKNELEAGEIITYWAPRFDADGNRVGEYINTHRIYSINGSKIKTLGDNNDNVLDEYEIFKSDIIGKCSEDDRVALLGGIIGFLRSSLGFFLCILLPLILFFLYELYKFIALIVSERAKRAPVSAEAEEEIKKRAIEEYLKAQGTLKEDAPEKENGENTSENKEKTEQNENDENN